MFIKILIQIVILTHTFIQMKTSIETEFVRRIYLYRK